MVTLQEVWQQINGLPHKYIFYTRKEIRYLPQILGTGERIYALTSGYMNGKTWLIVCTNRRVLFLNRGMFYGLQQIQMSLDRIQAIESNSQIFFGNIRMWDSASSISIAMILKSSLIPFVRTTQEAMDIYKRHMVHDMVNAAQAAAHPQPAAPAHPQPQAAPPQQTPHFIDELERLTKLKMAGQLTDQEFATAKAKLLSR